MRKMTEQDFEDALDRVNWDERKAAIARIPIDKKEEWKPEPPQDNGYKWELWRMESEDNYQKWKERGSPGRVSDAYIREWIREDARKDEREYQRRKRFNQRKQLEQDYDLPDEEF